MFLRQYLHNFKLYFISIYLIFKNKDGSKIIILSPLIGILISVINAVLDFYKNFDPSRVDVFKTFIFHSF